MTLMTKLFVIRVMSLLNSVGTTLIEIKESAMIPIVRFAKQKQRMMRTSMFAVTHARSYEGTDIVAVCDDLPIAESIAREVEDSLHKYSTDTVEIISFASNKLYEAGIAIDLTEGRLRTHRSNWKR